MNARRILALFLILASLVVGVPRSHAQAAQPPSVLVIVLDDVGWEDMASVPLANIQGAAPAARVYERFYSCPVCSPSRVAMFSGTYPHRAFVGGALNVSEQFLVGMPSTWKTLPEALSSAGYSTALFGKGHVSGLAGAHPLEQMRVHGFERWRAGISSNITSPASHYNWTRIDDGKQAATTTYSTTAVVDATVAWWSATSGPKFAVLAPMAPHEPFDAPPASKLPAGYVVGSTARARFEAAIVSLDFHLTALLGVIDFSTTHVVLVSDNGTAHQVPPPNGQSPGYKLTVYEGGVRLPLMWWGPGVQPGTDLTLVQGVDLTRTILEVCGVLSPVAFPDSISFAATLDGSPAGPNRRQHCYVSRFAPNYGTAPALTIDNFAVIREDGWKLLQEGSVYRLFHVTSDPWEQGGFDPAAPGFGSVTADLLGFRSAVLGAAWPY